MFCPLILYTVVAKKKDQVKLSIFHTPLCSPHGKLQGKRYTGEKKYEIKITRQMFSGQTTHGQISGQQTSKL